MTASRFHPGSTSPILTVWREPPAVSTTGWTATFMLRASDSDEEETLELTGVITVVHVADLDDAVAAQFPDITDVWQVVVTPDSADTQDLRGTYAAGLDLSAAGQNVPLLDDHSIMFGPDIAR